jgi:tetratricopeptide (TPR) repeat protein
LWQNEIALHRQAWDHGSKKFRVAINIGAAYQRLGKMADALEWHKKALDLNPGSGIALINLGLWYHTQSKALRGMLASQFVEHGVLHEQEYKQRVEEANQCEAQALALVREAVRACPNDPQVKKNADMVEDRARGLGVKVETTHSRPRTLAAL